MKRTILKEYLFYLAINTFVISLILGSFISINSFNTLKDNLAFMALILANNIDSLKEEDIIKKINTIEPLIFNKKIQLDILNNTGKSILVEKDEIYNVSNILEMKNEVLTEKTATGIGKYIINTYYLTENTNYIIKLSSFFSIFNIYFLTSFFLFIFNFLTAIFYTKSLRKNIIKPLRKITKDILNDKTPKRTYKFEELQTLNFYTQIAKKNFNKTIYTLKNENSKIDYILDNMNEGFLLIDEKLNILAINKSAKKILNCTEDAGKNIFHYTQNIKIINYIENAIKENKNVNFDISLNNKKTYSAYINQVKKENFKPKVKEYIILILDVTTERQNQKLKQELFSNISHELKTPITSIKGYTELLQNDFAKSEEQKQEFLKRIENETYNITQLINDILTISKLQNKLENLETIQINIFSLVEEITKSFLPMCIENNITIENNCENITINADYKDFYKLFSNLILNSIKYNKKNGYVKIYCKEQNENIEFIVKDSGIGIPAEDKNRIFERFYRVEKGRSKDTIGTGLGLSIVKYIVKFYNGKIKVKSKLGNGSTFIIKIPKNRII